MNQKPAKGRVGGGKGLHDLWQAPLGLLKGAHSILCYHVLAPTMIPKDCITGFAVSVLDQVPTKGRVDGGEGLHDLQQASLRLLDEASIFLLAVRPSQTPQTLSLGPLHVLAALCELHKGRLAHGRQDVGPLGHCCPQRHIPWHGTWIISHQS